jgi:hypothetical protein
MSQIKQILEGWGNRVKEHIGLLDEETRLMAEERLHICNICEVRDGNACSPQRTILNEVNGTMVHGCGCNISAKTLSPSSNCPASKW